jgi:glycosyltransferase involved in cell wall biosynthesis
MKSKPSQKRGDRSVGASVIVSLYNIVDSVEHLYKSLREMTTLVDTSWELVFVDDGSTDGTYDALVSLARKDPGMRVVKMRSNFGEAAALEAGLQYSRGERIVYMSGRVRVNPEAIPRFMERLDKGCDMVVGWRSPRRDSILNRFVSATFNRMASLISRVKLHDINSGVFVTYRSVLDRVEFYGNLYNFIPVLAGQQGYGVVEETIEQLSGSFRKSRYPREYIQRFLDIITVFFLSRYVKKPIHFLGFVGSLFMLAGLGIELYLFIYRILGMGPIAGRPLLVLGALLLVIGIQVITIGLLGEMIIFTHAGDIEEYNVEEVINE